VHASCEPSCLYTSLDCADIYDQFVAKTVELARKRTVDDPFSSENFDQGPQVSVSYADY